MVLLKHVLLASLATVVIASPASNQWQKTDPSHTGVAQYGKPSGAATGSGGASPHEQGNWDHSGKDDDDNDDNHKQPTEKGNGAGEHGQHQPRDEHGKSWFGSSGNGNGKGKGDDTPQARPSGKGGDEDSHKHHQARGENPQSDHEKPGHSMGGGGGSQGKQSGKGNEGGAHKTGHPGTGGDHGSHKPHHAREEGKGSTPWKKPTKHGAQPGKHGDQGRHHQARDADKMTNSLKSAKPTGKGDGGSEHGFDHHGENHKIHQSRDDSSIPNQSYYHETLDNLRKEAQRAGGKHPRDTDHDHTHDPDDATHPGGGLEMNPHDGRHHMETRATPWTGVYECANQNFISPCVWTRLDKNTCYNRYVLNP